MNLDHLLHLTPVSALGYAILHSLGQAALVFAALQFVLLWIKKPAPRYRLLYTAMLGLTALFLFTFFRQWYLLQNLQEELWIPGASIPAGDMSLYHFYNVDQLTTILPYAAIGYALGLILLLLRMALAWQQLATLKKTLVAATGDWAARFSSLKDRMGLGPKTTLCFSEKVRSPMMMGWLKPLVILPVALVNHLDIPQVATILIHELTHVRRKDYSWNLLQILMETLLFFNPVSWWLSAAIRRERELACDDQAMTYISEPLQYAEALLALEVQRMTLTGVLAAAGNGPKNLLFNRIKRITAMQTTHKSGSQGWLAIITLVGIIAATGAFFQAEAQHKKEIATTSPDNNHAPATVIVTDKPEKVHRNEDNQETTVPPPEAAAALHQAREILDDIDPGQIARDASESIDKEALKKALEEASTQIEKVDWQEINQSIRQAGEAVKAIDWNEIVDQINEGLKSVEGLESIEMDQVMEEVRQALQEAKNEVGHSEAAQRQKIREQSRQTRAKLEQSREKVKQQKRQREEWILEKMAVVRQEQKAVSLARKYAMENYRDTLRMKLLQEKRSLAADKGVSSLDWLLRDLDKVTIRLTDKALFINGKQQSDAAFNRVKKYMDRTGSSRIINKRSHKSDK